MKYKYITIQDIPQHLEVILDPQHPTCLAMDAERKLALNAPDLKQALEDITRVQRINVADAVLMAKLAQNALDKLAGK
jgi:hypothetical protein